MPTTDILNLDAQIQRLQQKKATLAERAEKSLFKKLRSLCGEEFSPQLIMGIVSDALTNATPQQKEVWVSAGSTFWKRTRKPKQTDD